MKGMGMRIDGTDVDGASPWLRNHLRLVERLVGEAGQPEARRQSWKAEQLFRDLQSLKVYLEFRVVEERAERTERCKAEFT